VRGRSDLIVIAAVNALRPSRAAALLMLRIHDLLSACGVQFISSACFVRAPSFAAVVSSQSGKFSCSPVTP
jgi:hypothetical protein